MPVNTRLVFTPVARAEIVDAQDWYEAEFPGLGVRFRAELDNVIERICSNPRQFPVVFQNARRALLRRFPYAVMFVLDPKTP